MRLQADKMNKLGALTTVKQEYYGGKIRITFYNLDIIRNI